MNDEHDSRITAPTGTGRAHEATVIIRFLFIAAIIVALVLVGFDNRAHVRVGYVFGNKQGPIWVVMVLSAIAGVIIGWLIKHRPRHRV